MPHEPWRPRMRTNGAGCKTAKVRMRFNLCCKFTIQPTEFTVAIKLCCGLVAVCFKATACQPFFCQVHPPYPIDLRLLADGELDLTRDPV